MTMLSTDRSTGRTYTFTVDDKDGDPIEPQANDKLRCRIGYTNATALLSFTSDAPTNNGSRIDKNKNATGGALAGTNRLRLDASDLATLSPGIYTIFIEFLDFSDDSEWKTVEREVLHVAGS